MAGTVRRSGVACRVCLSVMIFLSLALRVEGLFGLFETRKQKELRETEEAQTERYIEDLGLVGELGRLIFDALKDYQWYFKLATGYWLDKEMTVMIISIICNLIYCSSVICGMFIFAQNTMIVYGLLTFVIGPAIVLILIGLLALILGAMALYPMISVAILLFTWFFTTRLGQFVGTRLGLDQDDDGDVDFADFIFLLSKGAPSWMRLNDLHTYLQNKDKTVIQEVQDEVEDLEKMVKELTKVVKELQEEVRAANKKTT